MAIRKIKDTIGMNKKDALLHLKERERFFLDKGLVGSAMTMKDIYNKIKNSKDTNFKRIKTVGTYIE